MNDIYRSAKDTARMGAILNIIFGVLYILTLLGIPFGIVLLVMGRSTLNKIKESNEELNDSTEYFLRMGIFSFLLTIFGGFFYFMAYKDFKKTPTSEELMSSHIRYAQQMYREGLISFSELSTIEKQYKSKTY